MQIKKEYLIESPVS